jgi:hypothetical protein
VNSRVIKRRGWYIPQVYEGGFWKAIDSSLLHAWEEYHSQYKWCRHWTLWGAKKTLERYLTKDTIEVVYESDA